MTAVAPAVHYIVCATPRSGSTLLCGGLRNTGIAGHVDEWPILLRSRCGDYLKEIKERMECFAAFQKREGLDPSSPAFFRRFVELCAGPNGVFGVKLFKWDFNFISRMAGEAYASSGATLRERLNACFPNVRYVFLRREALVDQAVSMAIALQTERWSSDLDAVREPTFDFAAIERQCNLIAGDNREWEEFFKAQGIEPLRLTYDQLRADYEGCIRKTLDFVGIDAPPDVVIRKPPMEKQANRVNREWIDRYLAMKGETASR